MRILRWLVISVVALAVLAAARHGSAQDEGAARLDRYGDPLPPGAVLRLGTIRWRFPGFVHAIAFSPDSELAITVGHWRNGHQSAILWESAAGRPLARLDDVTLTAFLPDGRRLATVAAEGKLRIWDLKSQTPIAEHALTDPETGEPLKCRQLAVTPDGKTLVTAPDFIRLWDVETGKHLRTLNDDQRDPDLHFALSSDGAKLASCHRRSLSIWNLREEGDPLVIDPVHAYRVDAVCFSADAGKVYTGGLRKDVVRAPDGRVISASAFAELRGWDAATGKKTDDFIDGQPGSVSQIVLSPGGASLLAKDYDVGVQRFSLETGAVEHTFAFEQPGEIAVSPDGRRLAAVALGGRLLRMWRLDSGEVLTPAREAHTDAVGGLAVSPDGRHVATGSSDGTVRIWDRASGKHVKELLFSAQTLSLMDVEYSPDGTTLAAAGGYAASELGPVVAAVKLWSCESGELVREYRLPDFEGRSLAFSADGKRLAAGWLYQIDVAIKSGAVVFDVGRDEPIRRIELGEVEVHAVALDEDGDRLWTAASGNEGDVIEWDVSTGKKRRALESGGCLAACLLPRRGFGIIAKSAGDKSKIAVFDLESGKALGTFDGAPLRNDLFVGLSADAIAVAPGGNWFVSGSQSHTVEVWSMMGEPLARFESPASAVISLAVTPDGKSIVSGLENGSALVWDIPRHDDD